MTNISRRKPMRRLSAISARYGRSSILSWQRRATLWRFSICSKNIAFRHPPIAGQEKRLVFRAFTRLASPASRAKSRMSRFTTAHCKALGDQTFSPYTMRYGQLRRIDICQPSSAAHTALPDRGSKPKGAICRSRVIIECEPSTPSQETPGQDLRQARRELLASADTSGIALPISPRLERTLV